MLAPLRRPAFRSLFASATLSSAGDWLDLVALLTLVSVTWSLGPRGLALIGLAAGIPSLLGPLLGVYVDWFPTKVVMVSADVFRAVATALLLWAPNIALVTALVLFRGLCSVVFASAEQTALVRTVPQQELVQANSLNQLMTQGAKIFGPGVGGILVGSFGVRVAFFINACTFAAAATIMASARLGEISGMSQPHAGRRLRYFQDLREGASFVARSTTLAVCCCVLGAMMVVIFFYDSMSPLAVSALGLGPEWIGYLMGAVGAGGAIGAVLVGRLFHGDHALRVIGLAVVVVALVVFGVGWSIHSNVRFYAWFWACAMLLLGMASSAVLIPYSYTVQVSTPEKLMGRVTSLLAVLPGVAGVASPPVAAVAVERWGVGDVFAASGIVLIVVGALVAVVRPRAT